MTRPASKARATKAEDASIGTSGARSPARRAAEPPVTVVDKVVDRKKTRTVAEGYLNFLYSPTAQDLIGKNHYRPRNAAAVRPVIAHRLSLAKTIFKPPRPQPIDRTAILASRVAPYPPL